MKCFGAYASLFLLIAFGLWSPSTAAVIHVPADQLTIQKALDSAVNLDTVEVAPGVYHENINFKSKDIWLTSTSGSSQTIIESAAPNTAVITTGRTNATHTGIDGFTIRNAGGASGIYTELTPLIIQNCEIYNCTASPNGGGIRAVNSWATIRNCNIHDNSSVGFGGGIFLDTYGAVTVESNRIHNNRAPRGAGVGAYDGLEYAQIRRNVIWNNLDTGKYAAGIYLNDSPSQLVNNTIVGNSHGIALYGQNNRIVNNIIAGNVGASIFEYYPHSCYADYNDVWNNGVQDTVQYYGISQDPLFTDPAHFDFTLLPESPCIDRGNPDTLTRDSDGSRCDIGAFAVKRTWPIPVYLNVGTQPADHFVGGNPTFYWKYKDSSSSTQTHSEFEISTSLRPFLPYLWSRGSDTSSDTSIAYTGPSMREGNSFYYRIRVNNGTSWGDWVYSQLHVNLPPGVPTPRTPITGETAFADAVQLVVDTASNPESDTSIVYDFQLRNSSDTSQAPIQELTMQRHPYSGLFVNLTAGQTYWWRARAYDWYQYSEWSQPTSFVARGNTTFRVPSPYPTIQAAINAASPGDTVLVAAGTYTGTGNRDLQFFEKAIILESVSGASNTTINIAGTPGDPHKGIILNSALDSGIVVSGFTFQNGYDSIGGVLGGIRGTITFRGCTFRKNKAWGGGVSSTYTPTFDSCLFDNNSATFAGGVIFNSQATFNNCSFVNHITGGIAAWALLALSKCTIAGNGASGSSSLFMSCGGTMSDCLIVRNKSTCFAGSRPSFDYTDGFTIQRSTIYGNAQLFSLNPYEGHILRNSVVADNAGIVTCCCGPGHSTPAAYGHIALGHCILYNPGYSPGDCMRPIYNDSVNTTADPLFCDTTGLNFSVASNSPCIGAGVNGVNIGAFGSACGPRNLSVLANTLPQSFSLSPNYPNPFNPSTVIEYGVPAQSHVAIAVYNLLGQQIRTLVDADQPAGTYKATWDGTDSRGKSVASGIYFYRLESGTTVLSRKMLLLK